MMPNHHAMLSPVLEIGKSVETYVPLGGHSLFQKLWKEETQAVLQESLDMSEVSQEEKLKAEEYFEIVSDAVSIFTREASNSSWAKMSLAQRLAKVKSIQDSPQIPQRSPEWYLQFGKVLTASEFSALFSNNKRRRDLAQSKAVPPIEPSSPYRHACPTSEMSALGWGIRFEPVVKQLLEYRDKCSIYEPGRLNHPTNTHLAASPDGLIQTSSNPQQVGRLVEIKCPYSRTIGGEIPSDYWIQMQIQMEVADVDECEYIEVDLISKKANQGAVDLSETTYQGNVYLLQQQVEEGKPFDYKYVYGEIGSSTMPSFPEGYKCIETIPWGLKQWHRKIVSRDRTWYEGTKPWQEAFWRDVEAIKQGLPLTPLPNQKPVKQDVCLIQDD
jgi:hypothetical protein